MARLTPNEWLMVVVGLVIIAAWFAYALGFG